MKLRTFPMHFLSFKVTNCSFSHSPIHNTTEKFMQRKKMPPKSVHDGKWEIACNWHVGSWAIPELNYIGGNFEFQNARPHRARVAFDFLRQHGVRALPWPAKSPDMSPIENIWDVLGRRVRNRPQCCNTLQQLGRVLQEEWRRIPREIIRRTIASMPGCRAYINARGAWTRYWSTLRRNISYAIGVLLLFTWIWGFPKILSLVYINLSICIVCVRWWAKINKFHYSY